MNTEIIIDKFSLKFILIRTPYVLMNIERIIDKFSLKFIADLIYVI